jgi:hypothetical protein
MKAIHLSKILLKKSAQTQHLVQQLQKQQQSFFTSQCASYMFRPQHGHPQGDIRRKNKIIAEYVKDMLQFGPLPQKIKSFKIKLLQYLQHRLAPNTFFR